MRMGIGTTFPGRVMCGRLMRQRAKISILTETEIGCIRRAMGTSGPPLIRGVTCRSSAARGISFRDSVGDGRREWADADLGGDSDSMVVPISAMRQAGISVLIAPLGHQDRLAVGRFQWCRCIAAHGSRGPLLRATTRVGRQLSTARRSKRFVRCPRGQCPTICHRLRRRLDI